jgi:2-C-methyl-D-erythritol 4-phosphate cytidylyltransferase
MNSVVIVAAGSGTRMGPGVDKLFLELADRPVIAHTWQRWEEAADVDEIVLVVRPGLEPVFAELAGRFGFRKPHRFAAGGAARQDSVWNGLQAVTPGCELVAIHDGARPCTSPALIAATLAAARETGAAVAAERITDTVKVAEHGTLVTAHLDRSKLWTVQTPQAFRLAVILRALTAVREQGRVITDDTAACELIGQPVRLVESPTPNPKVTTPATLPWVELQLRRFAPG